MRHPTGKTKVLSSLSDSQPSLKESSDAWTWIAGLIGLTISYLIFAGSWWRLQYQVLPVSSGRNTHQAQTRSRQ